MLSSGTVIVNASLEHDAGAGQQFVGDVGVGAEALAFGEVNLDDVSLQRDCQMVLFSPDLAGTSGAVVAVVGGAGIRLVTLFLLYGVVRVAAVGSIREAGEMGDGASGTRLLAAREKQAMQKNLKEKRKQRGHLCA